MGADKLVKNTTNAPKCICPSPNVWDFDEKRLHWASVVRDCHNLKRYLRCVVKWAYCKTLICHAQCPFHIYTKNQFISQFIKTIIMAKTQLVFCCLTGTENKFSCAQDEKIIKNDRTRIYTLINQVLRYCYQFFPLFCNFYTAICMTVAIFSTAARIKICVNTKCCCGNQKKLLEFSRFA